MKYNIMNDNNFRVRIYVETTRERCVVNGLNKNSTVSSLKERIEELVGIPSFLLQLYYLDECPLVDKEKLKEFHILPDARIKARVWRTHERLVKTSRDGEWDDLRKELKTCGVELNDDRMLISLFISCFHGNANVVDNLLSCGVKYRRCLPSGREAIQVAALRGHITCTELLLRRKVRPYEWNNERVSLTNWTLQDKIKAALDRIESTRKCQNHAQYSRMTNSQMYDSALSTWYKGAHAQLYLCEILDNTKLKDVTDDDRPVFRP